MQFNAIREREEHSVTPFSLDLHLVTRSNAFILKSLQSQNPGHTQVSFVSSSQLFIHTFEQLDSQDCALSQARQIRKSSRTHMMKRSIVPLSVQSYTNLAQQFTNYAHFSTASWF